MKSKLLSTVFNCGLRSTSFVGVLAAIVIAGYADNCWAGWTRGLPIGEVAADERKAPESFVLEVWSGDDDGHVYGLCMYFNSKSLASTIEGIETPDGSFYPHVSNQVADAKHGSKWTTVEATALPRGKVATQTVQPEQASRSLRVDLDVFRPFIGKGKFGRLLLKNGESAVFQIDDLQPPEKRTESSTDFVTEKK